jgi:hypothetical protein
MLDPAADPARRVWIACTPCGSTAGLYLLESTPRLLWVQCGACFARYWLDTRCGCGRPDFVNDQLAWPA